jgi:mannose-6-phosphate isomerase-like protein (cupin superfamily)
MTRLAQPLRRIVTIDDTDGRSRRLSDGPISELSFDPARPGYVEQLVWIADAKNPRAPHMAQAHHAIEPPPKGSLCRIITFPPDAAFGGKVGAAEIADYFAAAGSPKATTYAANGRHPYMQRTRTLDFCLVLEGRITLILDTQEVDLEAGDTVIQRGTNHAWSNRSAEPCTLAITLVDAVDAPA